MTTFTLFALWPVKPIRAEIESRFGLQSTRPDATTLVVSVPSDIEDAFIDYLLRSHITFEGVAQ